jgi:hypothetical protein
VTSANISSALYQMSTDLWTVFMENCGPARDCRERLPGPSVSP